MIRPWSPSAALALGLVLVLGAVPAAAGPTTTPSAPDVTATVSTPFTDLDDSKFQSDIVWIYEHAITVGCAEDRYCPKGLVTRAQMATFLTRALSLPAATRDYFSDDADSKHEARINALAEAGITVGCGGRRFCPDGTVTRGQMATLLVRGFNLGSAVRDYFSDDSDSKHEARINALAQAGVTRGCSTTTYCPAGAVNREQMAAFLHRAVAPGPGVLVGAGDIAWCSSTGDEATAALLDGIAGTVFTTGDNVYESGTPAEFANCYEPSWGRHRARTLPAPGNHDWRTVNAEGYRDYFGFGPGPLWYSYNLAGWHVVVLDSNCDKVGGCGPGSPQHTWLLNDLAADTHACTAAIWHAPRFSSGAHGSSTAAEAFWTALYEDGAEIVVNGHDHNYERFAPQTPAAVAHPNGIRQFVVGTGGKTLRLLGPTLANSEIRNSQIFGVLKLTLTAGHYAWRFVPVGGAAFSDAGTGTCH